MATVLIITVAKNGSSMTKKCWDQMGVELEGSWYKKREDIAHQVRGAKAHDDRSVHIGTGNPGEIVTRPHADLDSLCKDAEVLWPDLVHESCGFHIHASFSPLYGSMVATKEFYKYFKERWELWGKKVKLDRTHEFWGRLQGRNKFAADKFEPERQLTTSNGQGQSRYTMLNFHSWEKHGTVECRLLPMFADKEVGISAIRELADIYDTYLSEHPFPTISLASTTEVQGDVVVERYEQPLPELTPRQYVAVGHFPEIERGENVFYAIDGAMDKVQPFKKVTEENTP
jgi:hypothetical protein